MKKTSGADKMAVVYARYSSHGQTEQSIEGQLAAAETYAKAKGYTIVHEYIDRAMTGRNDNRDEFQRMLSDTAKKQFSVIIVWKVDRFGRNREEITFNKYRCKKNGVRVEYVAESVPDSAEGVILESVLEGMAEYYSLQLSQNVRRGMLESAKKHKAIGGHIPLGFKVDSDNNYVIDEDTAPTVRMIFQLYAEGSTISEILSRLNSMGLKTAEGRTFGKCSLAVLLKNEKYIGTYKYKDLIDDPDAIPAIVDKDIFWQVQSMLKVNRRKPSRKWSYTDFLLTDKLFCGKCGSPMSGESGTSKSGRKFSYYGCAGRRKDRICTKRPVRQDRIEEAVLRKMQTIIENDELLNFIAEQTWAYYVEQDERQDRIRSIQAQIDADERAIANLLKVLERGIVSEATVARVEELENEKTALKAALADAQLESGPHVTKDSILFFLHQFKTLDYTDRDCQRRLIDTFVNAVFVYDDKIRIAFNWSGDSDTIALDDVDAAIDGGGEVFARCLPCPAKKTPEIIRFQAFFVSSETVRGLAILSRRRAKHKIVHCVTPFRNRSVWYSINKASRGRGLLDIFRCIFGGNRYTVVKKSITAVLYSLLRCGGVSASYLCLWQRRFFPPSQLEPLGDPTQPRGVFFNVVHLRDL